MTLSRAGQWRWHLAAAIVGGILLTACTTMPPVTPAPLVPLADAAFGVDGRLSAKRGDEGIAVGFSWRHDPPRDEISITTPLDQAVAELSGDGARSEVAIVLADGRREAAADWPALTARTLGFPFPVAGLSAWMRGAPHAHSPWTAEPDASGRTGVLRQDGWEIVYGYAGEAERQPSRLRLTAADVELRVVIDRWH